MMFSKGEGRRQVYVLRVLARMVFWGISLRFSGGNKWIEGVFEGSGERDPSTLSCCAVVDRLLKSDSGTVAGLFDYAWTWTLELNSTEIRGYDI
jgi:hypothetical protein